MIKRLSILLIAIISVSACKKSTVSSGCTTICTAQYTYTPFGILLTDSKNPSATFTNITVINLRTNKVVKLPAYPPNMDFSANFVLVAANDNKSEFSTNGDDIRITATNSVTGITKSAVIKISGGCNCNVAKISGPDRLDF